MIKKIGIITIVKVNNYGAELQAFALQKKLEELGFHSEIIDYLYYKNWQFEDTAKSAPFIPMSGKQKIIYVLKYRIVAFLLEKILPFFNKEVRLRIRNFEEFHRINTCFSQKFPSIDSLYNYHFDYDIFIVGSDQVWNPTAFSSIEPYFLTFAPLTAKKLSYASSFGVTSIDDNLRERFVRLLSSLDSISVRESSGVELVKQLTGKNAELVLDPTLLLTKEDWSLYMKEMPDVPAKYILIYQLSESAAIVDLAKRISKEKGLPICRICKRAFRVEKNEGIKNILYAGPSEFLSLIAHAEYMITDSFHGTAFSVNFNISFYTIVGIKKKNNSRMESLLEMVGLKYRLLWDTIDINEIDIVSTPDFSLANKKLALAQETSVNYLINSLS